MKNTLTTIWNVVKKITKAVVQTVISVGPAVGIVTIVCLCPTLTPMLLIAIGVLAVIELAEFVYAMVTLVRATTLA